jgi:hypothetical protein
LLFDELLEVLWLELLEELEHLQQFFLLIWEVPSHEQVYASRTSSAMACSSPVMFGFYRGRLAAPLRAGQAFIELPFS